MQTQPLSDDENAGSFDEGDGNENTWGRLVSLNPNLPSVDLENDQYILGRRATCDVTFEDQPAISGFHCKLFREKLGSKGEFTVWIQDTSTNGTYCNGEALGKGNRELLQNGTTICLLKGKTATDSIKYMFQDLKEVQKEIEEGGPSKDYKILDILGSGNFATVKKCIHKNTGKEYALKIIDKKKFLLSASTKRPNALQDEVGILRGCSHPNIIGINDVYETSTTLYLVLELATGGELFDKIIDAGGFKEDVARRYFKQILEAIKYLHSQGIAHRDLKPENILLGEGDIIKLSDFGLSRIVDEQQMMKTMAGTPQYVAPEILMQAKKKGGYSKACDLWSIGVILFVLLIGSPPFYERGDSVVEKDEEDSDDEMDDGEEEEDDGEPDLDNMSLWEQIKTASYEFDPDFWEDYSEESKDLIKHLLVVDPEERYSVEDCFAHCWVKGTKLPKKGKKRKGVSTTQSNKKRKTKK